MTFIRVPANIEVVCVAPFSAPSIAQLPSPGGVPQDPVHAAHGGALTLDLAPVSARTRPAIVLAFAAAATLFFYLAPDPIRQLQRLAVPLFPGSEVRALAPQSKVATRELERAEARHEITLPLVADLSVLRSPQSRSIEARPEPAATAAPISIATEPGPRLPASHDLHVSATAAVAPPTGLGGQTSSGEGLAGTPIRLPPLRLAALESQITASDGNFDGLARRRQLCDVEPVEAGLSEPPTANRGPEFGRALAAAALKQTTDFVVYTDKYRRLSFPMGDVPSLFGVCTDVVIRAYRAVGIDLQADIHTAHIGSADTSIAHRRTFTLRRYFASRGASLAITDYPEDFLPGDVVTYDRPQNRGSRDHIAIVADVTAPSGRPMIVHNRGWGPQLEDALFVDRITGHYRFRGEARGGLSAPRQSTRGFSGVKNQRDNRRAALRLRSQAHKPPENSN